MNHSGVLGALLQFLTGVEPEGEAGEARDGDGEGCDDSVAAAEDRLRLFLHVFADMPLSVELVPLSYILNSITAYVI